MRSLQACDEILAGKLADQFVVDVYQAGAGTSFHMNVNEVVGGPRGGDSRQAARRPVGRQPQ